MGRILADAWVAEWLSDSFYAVAGRRSLAGSNHRSAVTCGSSFPMRGGGCRCRSSVGAGGCGGSEGDTRQVLAVGEEAELERLGGGGQAAAAHGQEVCGP